jgi:hypothetical protein
MIQTSRTLVDRLNSTTLPSEELSSTAPYPLSIQICVTPQPSVISAASYRGLTNRRSSAVRAPRLASRSMALIHFVVSSSHGQSSVRLLNSLRAGDRIGPSTLRGSLCLQISKIRKLSLPFKPGQHSRQNSICPPVVSRSTFELCRARYK